MLEILSRESQLLLAQLHVKEIADPWRIFEMLALDSMAEFIRMRAVLEVLLVVQQTLLV